MIFHFVSNSCSNFSMAPDSHVVRYQNQVWYMLCALLPVCISGVVANSLSFCIFWHQSFDNKAVRLNLLSISMAEIVTQLLIVLESSLVFTGVGNVQLRWSVLLKSLTHWGINSSICVRNWFVLLLTVSRCEVVANPLSVRKKMLFGFHRAIGLEIVFVLLSLSLSFLNNLRYMMKICSNLGGLVIGHSLLVKYRMFVYFQLYGIFMFQSCLPVVVTTSATIIIWISLRHATNIRRQSNVDVHRHCQSKRSVRATTTTLVLVFSIVFCVLQIPTFIATCVTTFRSSHDYAIHPDIFANTFCILGSLSNFFVYAVSSKRFRMSLAALMGGGGEHSTFSDHTYLHASLMPTDNLRKLSDRSVCNM